MATATVAPAIAPAAAAAVHSDEPAAKKPRARSSILYIGAANDVAPVLGSPELDWVFLCPEPAHPVALEHWPPGCLGHSMFVKGGQELFLDILHGCLGRKEWTFSKPGVNEALFVAKTGQTVRVFYNTAIEDDLNPWAKECVQNCRSYIHFGLELTDEMKSSIDKLLPGAKHEDALHDKFCDKGDYLPVGGGPPALGQHWEFVKHEWDREGSCESDESHDDASS